ncbi:MAG: AzlD domain-containing protein [Alphaproteobacteria bacterium]|jgi:branched-subunit amino acid transport protein
MRVDVLQLALIVGACTWAFRYVPLRMDLSRLQPDGLMARFLAATAPAAIGTLFVAEVMPYLRQPLTQQAPLLAGVTAVIAVFVRTRSAVVATLAGSLAFGLLTVL